MRAILVSPNHASRKATVLATTLAEHPDSGCNTAACLAGILDHLPNGVSVGIQGSLGTRLQDHIAFFAVPSAPQAGYLAFPQLYQSPLGGSVVIVGARIRAGRLQLVDASVSCRTVESMEHWYCPPEMARRLYERASNWRSQARGELLAAQAQRYVLCAGFLRMSCGWEHGLDQVYQAQDAHAVAAPGCALWPGAPMQAEMRAA